MENERNSNYEAGFLSSGGTVDGRHNMFQVTQAMVVIKARFSLNEKLKRILGLTATVSKDYSLCLRDSLKTLLGIPPAPAHLRRNVGQTSRDKFELKTFRGHVRVQESTMTQILSDVLQGPPV